jgi:hypothetical protein
MPPSRPSQVPLPSFDARPAAVVDARAPSFRAPLSGQGAPQPSFTTVGNTSEFVSADSIDVEDEDEHEADRLPSFDTPDLRAPAPPAFSMAPAPPQFSMTSAAPSFSMGPAAPSLLSALKQRVRFAGGEVPLWSLLAPMVVLLALGSAFAAAALGSPDEPTAVPLASASSAPALPSVPVSALEAAPEPAPTAATQAPALPASSIDTEALEARRAEELTKSEALALATSRRQREVARVAVLRQKLSRDPGLFQDAATLTELRRAAEDPLTAPDALSAIAEAPGPLSADLLYEMWTGTVVRNSATELARSLVFSKEVRAKASPELAVALDLRIAETCEQNKALLPRVLDKGDRRSLALLARLSRKFGCGPNKRLDCYPCLREGQVVDEAMVAVKKRREPKPFSGK